MHCRPEARTFRLLASRHGCRCNRLLYCDIFATCNSSWIRTVHRLGVLHTVRECCIPSVSAQLLLYFFTSLLFSTVCSFIHYAFIYSFSYMWFAILDRKRLDNVHSCSVDAHDQCAPATASDACHVVSTIKRPASISASYG